MRRLFRRLWPQNDEAIIAALIAGLDPAGLEGVLAEGHAELNSGKNRAHYLDLESTFRRLLPRFNTLDLYTAFPRRILDIGAGPGHFSYLCRHFGHDCLSLDLPSRPLFSAMRKWFGSECIEHRIRAQQPLPPFRCRFHWVTALHVQFNKKLKGEQRHLWEIDDWCFFLDDLRDNVLVPGGGFLLRPNYEVNKWPGPPHSELQSFFAARGGQPSGDSIYFPVLL